MFETLDDKRIKQLLKMYQCAIEMIGSVRDYDQDPIEKMREIAFACHDGILCSNCLIRSCKNNGFK